MSKKRTSGEQVHISDKRFNQGFWRFKAVQPGGKLSSQAERRDSHFSKSARSVILSRDSKVINARIIRWALRPASQGRDSDSESGSRRDEDRYQRPKRAVILGKSRTQRGYTTRSQDGY